MPRFQRGPSATAQSPEVSGIRELRRADLAVLAAPRPRGAIVALRDSHHRIARAIASGMNNSEVAETCGISYQRVSILRQDPSFVELVAHYRSLITADWVREADPVIDYMRHNALKAQAMISDKLDKATEEDTFLPTRDLLGIAELGLDRTGYGKVNKNVNVNVDFAAQLEAARKRSAAAPTVRTIEAQALPAAAPQSGLDAGALPVAERRVPSSPFRRL